MSPPDPLLTVDMTLDVGTFEVVASFEAGPGITALTGPSGSGKSLTLAAVAGLLRPAQGRITLGGETVADPAQRVHVPTQRRGAGMVFQQAALWPHRTPLDNVALAIRDDVDRRTRRGRAAHWLDRVQAGHLAHAPTRSLSGGEQQRVALARALAGDPQVLLLDEPFSALDQATRRALRALVRELVDDRQLTTLLVTHDLDDIVDLADQVVLFEPGRTTGTRPLRRGRADDLAHALGLA